MTDAVEVASRRAALLDHLIESAVEPRQRVGDAVRSALLAGARRCVRLSHALKLPRQVVETLVDGREVVADHLVVVMLSV
jgi:hypothetical protein